MANDESQELLETIVKKISYYPDAVKVTKSIDEMGTLYSIDLDPRDAGMVIGKQGATINAIRGVIRSVAGKNKCAANISLNVPDKPRTEKRGTTAPYRTYQKPRKERFDDVDNQF